MHGPVDGRQCGVVVMNHPDNFRFPQWVRLHPKMPYFVFAPMVEEPFMIEPGKPYVSKFRYLTYDGTPDHEVIEGSLEKNGLRTKFFLSLEIELQTDFHAWSQEVEHRA